MKLLVTGGHLTPALALIDYLRAHAPSSSFIWLGRAFAQEQTGQKSREQIEAQSRNISFFSLPTSKLVAGTQIRWSQISQFWQATKVASSIIRKEKPTVYVSFGGYLSVPTALACWWHKVPIVVHEQTRKAGLANKMVAQLATRIFVADAASQRLFPARKTVLIGNLLRENVLLPSPIPPQWLPQTTGLPLLYVAGGSQGSQAINSCLAELLPLLVKEWQVLHQCGPASQLHQPLTEFERLRLTLPPEDQAHYTVREWLEPNELSWVLHHAILYLGRSGANTVWEVAAMGIPSIFIPLPNARDQEQHRNAELLVNAQAAILLDQAHLTPSTLLETITQAKKSLPVLTTHAQSHAKYILRTGTATLAQYLVSEFSPPQ